MLNNYISLFGLQIRIYSIMFALGILWTLEFAKHYTISKYPDLITKNKFDDLAIFTIIIGLVGARLWYVTSDLGYYLTNPLEIFMVWKGGVAIQGGVMGVALGIYYWTKKHNISNLFIPTASFVMFGGLIGQAFARWGNFYNQEVYGKAISMNGVVQILLVCITIQTLLMIWILKPYKLYKERKNINGYWILRLLGTIFYITMLIRTTLTSYGTKMVLHMNIQNQFRTPLFIIEGTLNMIAFIIIGALSKNKEPKYKLASYFLAYGIIRSSLELFRTNADIMKIGIIPISFVLSIIFIILGLTMFYKFKRSQ